MKNPKRGQIVLYPDPKNQKERMRHRQLFGDGEQQKVNKNLARCLIEVGITTAEEFHSVAFSKTILQLALDLGVDPVNLGDFFSRVRKVIPKHKTGSAIRLLLNKFPVSGGLTLKLSIAKTSSIEVIEEHKKTFDEVRKKHLVLLRAPTARPFTNPPNARRKFLNKRRKTITQQKVKKQFVNSHFCSLIDRHMPPIRHQGDRATCLAFTLCAICEYQESAATTRGPKHYSEQFLHWFCKRIDGLSPHEGTDPHLAVSHINEDGLLLNKDWPYQPLPNAANPTYHPPPSNTATAQRHFPAECLILPNPQDVAELKRLLQMNYTIGVVIPVFDKCFWDWLVVDTGNIRRPLLSEVSSYDGNQAHSIVLVGYRDVEGRPEESGFIIRNSWGKEWGRNSIYGKGYGTIPYNYIAEHAWSAFIAKENLRNQGVFDFTIPYPMNA